MLYDLKKQCKHDLLFQLWWHLIKSKILYTLSALLNCGISEEDVRLT